MRKIKIFITIFVLYEFVMLSVLQIPAFCSAIFNRNFCGMNNFKYFLMCVMLPALLMLFFWWMPDIARPFCKNKCQCDESENEQKPIQKSSSDIISRDDMERLIGTAITIGIQKFAKSHPKTTKAFDNVIATITDSQKQKKKK